MEHLLELISLWGLAFLTMVTIGMCANVCFFSNIQEKNFKTMALPLLVLCGIFLFTYSASLFLENIFSPFPLLISVWGIFCLILYTYHFAITLAFCVYDSEAKKKCFRHISIWILVVYAASLFVKSNIFSLLTFSAMISAIGAAVLPSLLFQKGFPELWKEFLLLLWGWTVLVFSAEIFIVFLTELINVFEL